jgi:DNA polymerase elongation subunit (family B)
MITLNISPETKYAKIDNWDEEEFAKGTDRKYNLTLYKDTSPAGQFQDVFSQLNSKSNIIINGSEELRKFIDKNNLSVASNGCMYTMDKLGVIPSILSLWFDTRDEYKKLRKKYEAEGDQANAAFYDRKQLITKIMLNSFYGVLLLKSFRFYDKDNGEAVTLTGQSVIHHATRAADYFYNKELQEHNCDYEIEMEDGTVKKYHGFDKVKTQRGDIYVFSLTENDVLV